MSNQAARLRRKKADMPEEIIEPIQPQVKKKFSLKDIKPVRPLTETQKAACYEWSQDQNLFMDGFAGTGKTFLAMYLGLTSLLDPDTPQDKLIIVRSITPSKEIGFLPGTIEEKISPYEAVYRQIADELFTWKNSYDNLKELGLVRFEATSFLRGNTFNNAIIIMDEIQNGTAIENLTAVTRVGKNSRVIFCGDDLQTDERKSGWSELIPIIRRMESVSFIDFKLEDIVRSGFCKEFLTAYYSRK